MNMFDMYVYKGIGTTKIATILNSMNIPTAVNGQWAHYTVNKIIKNVKYIGKIYYDGNIYDGHHEPIIDAETFELAQKFRKDRTWDREYRGVNYAKYMLAGLLRCGECGKSMQVKHCKTGKRVSSIDYFICNSAIHTDSKNRCTHMKYHSIQKTDKEFIDALSEILKEIEYSLPKKKMSADFNIERKAKLEKELARAKQAYLSEVFTLEEYGELKQRLEKELNEITILPEKEKHEIKTLYDSFVNADTMPEKKAMLKQFINTITIKNTGEINIDFMR
jgi:site-specific DNA recombinase